MLGYVTEIWKQPSESPRRSHTWEDNLPQGSSIGAATALCTRLDNSEDTTSAMITGESIIGMIQLYTIQAGEDGKDYRITLQMTRSDGQELEDEILLHVREL